VVHGERVCRSSAEHYREWVIKRKAEIAEEERRKEAERRRLERERLERLEKARVGRLLAQAKALREAQEIRGYVSAVRDRQATLHDALSEAEFREYLCTASLRTAAACYVAGSRSSRTTSANGRS
jgi:hypothetical protein